MSENRMIIRKTKKKFREKYYSLYRFVDRGWNKVRPSTIKHYYERAKHGYSYQDNWAMDSYMIETLLPMFENLKNDTHGAGMQFYLTEDGVDEVGNPTDSATEKALDRQQNVYGEIIYGLKCAKQVNDMDFDYKKDFEKMNNSVKRSFELIGEYFFTFWN